MEMSKILSVLINVQWSSVEFHNDEVVLPRPHLIEIDLTRKMLAGELKRSSISSPRLLILTPIVSRYFRPAYNTVRF
jgi:hypothetical protein